MTQYFSVLDLESNLSCLMTLARKQFSSANQTIWELHQKLADVDYLYLIGMLVTTSVKVPFENYPGYFVHLNMLLLKVVETILETLF